MPLNDRRLQQIKQAFKDLEKVKITVGLQGNAGSDVVMRAFWTQYGTDHMPAWAWQRKAATIYEEPIKKLSAKSIKKMMITYASIHESYLHLIGMFMQESWQRQIRNTTIPAIKPYTAMKKGSEKPLIDTGQMMNSIRYEVIM